MLWYTIGNNLYMVFHSYMVMLEIKLNILINSFHNLKLYLRLPYINTKLQNIWKVILNYIDNLFKNMEVYLF